MTDITWNTLVTLWDRQQSAYIASREARFDALLDILALQFDDAFSLLELGCGPGSLTRRILQRFPAVHVTAVDVDPVMLAIARETLLPFGDRVRILSADLATPDWQQKIVGTRPEAIVSSTALHWLMPDRQHALHGEIHKMLADNGVFLNADHQRFNPADLHKKAISERHDVQTQQRAWAHGAVNWETWFTLAKEIEDIARLIPAREAVFAGRPVPPPTTVAFQLASLNQAGFSETGTLWQLMDDYLIAGWK
ncbi:class I SAM-dependent methyltransferase [Enterobacter sp. Cy-643]|uniref:class I SAM-dependent methyltransferase n=1 Tax=Enterobacter sp. Cy-643 TaxID=2608346 RepID=UPI00141FDBCD|nr:class I SAM-dependent methyltransferase [Enterobacter sp. Cy-643]NIF31353.1 class I SAM-dependent methyltransferase [Enterobacter sp. Cy-643]